MILVIIIAGFVSVVGCGYLIGAALLIDRFARKASSTRRASMPGVTILKPLHGAELGLLENLASFCARTIRAPFKSSLACKTRIRLGSPSRPPWSMARS
jgi:ceramide glucosyltransferase